MGCLYSSSGVWLAQLVHVVAYLFLLGLLLDLRSRSWCDSMADGDALWRPFDDLAFLPTTGGFLSLLIQPALPPGGGGGAAKAPLPPPVWRGAFLHGGQAAMAAQANLDGNSQEKHAAILGVWVL